MRASLTKWFILAAAVLVFAQQARPALADPIYSLVVGVNEPLDKKTKRLRFADDDAILFHKLLSSVGPSVALVELDEDTSRLHKLAGALPPTRANMVAAIGKLMWGIRQARARGEKPHFYLIYSGHGDVKNNEGYLALSDGRFTASDLAELVLARSEAVVNHVIIDACRSYYLVHEKRAGGRHRPVERGFHRSESLTKRFPNTGFLLSTSSAALSHEWAEFQAGIFSHEVRSGMLGAADINLDGRVSYDEIWAFVRVANSKIPNRRFRPKVYVKAPNRDGSSPLIDMRRIRGAAVTIPPTRASRYLLEDKNGVRIADLHTSKGAPVRIWLPHAGLYATGAGERLYLHDLHRSVEYQVNTGWRERKELALLGGQPSSFMPKGAAHEAFARVFEQPFSLDAYRVQLQCTRKQAQAAQCPSYYCDRCRCEGCRHVGAEVAPPPEPQEPTPVVRQTRARRPWETFLRLSGGLKLLDRSFEITDPVDPSYGVAFQSGVAPAMTIIDAEFFPWASQGWPVLSRIGATLRYYRTLDLKAQTYDGETMDTVLYQLDTGLLFRWHLFDRITSPTLRLGAEYGMFGLDIDDSRASKQVPMPDISYEYLRLRILDLEWPLLHRGRFVLGLSARLHYLVVISEGMVTGSGDRGFGPSDTGAIEVGGGVFGSVGKFFFALSGSYQRFFLDFQHDRCDNPWSNTSCRSAGGALDETSDLSLTFGYLY